MAVRKTVYPLILLCVILTLGLLVYSLDQENIPLDLYEGRAALPIPSPLSTSVWGVFNTRTGKLVMENHAEEVRPIASVTKLFTAYAVVTEDSLQSPVVISWEDLNVEGDAGKLFYGEEMTQRELLFPLLLESSNDAGAALERSLGEELTGNINRVIHTLGLTDTRLSDATGLSPQNVSSVADLARFYAYIHTTYPYLTDITQLRMYLGTTVGWVNNNPGRSFPDFTGGKHGYTPEAGRTFVGSFRAESGEEIGIVLLGSTDLQADLTTLASHFRIARDTKDDSSGAALSSRQ